MKYIASNHVLSGSLVLCMGDFVVTINCPAQSLHSVRPGRDDTLLIRQELRPPQCGQTLPEGNLVHLETCCETD